MLSDGNQAGVGGKEYYTNSFHIPVSMEATSSQKLAWEGPFHAYCSGGSISYVELSESPKNNPLAVETIVEKGIRQDCWYMGRNYPMDICPECGARGTFFDCASCGCASEKIRRIRRVSGYLAPEERFTEGKSKELHDRRPSDL